LGAPSDSGSRKGESSTCKIEPLSPDTSAKTPFLAPLATRHRSPYCRWQTHRFWKDRNSGERQSATTWHRCVVFGKLANYAGTLTKGAFIQLEGEIRVREYFPRVIADSASSVKKSITEIRVFRIMNLDRPGKPGQSGEPV
jgi:hypothetical protein